jgi:multidrug efflux pump subunit AcrA (membrane-fusion protein)
VLVAVAAIAAAYLLLKPRDDRYVLRDYSTATVELRTIRQRLQLGGTVRVRTEATARAPGSGTLRSLEVGVGDWVAPGQTVAILDAGAFRGAYEARQRSLQQSTRAHESLLPAQEQEGLQRARDRRRLEAALEGARVALAVSTAEHAVSRARLEVARRWFAIEYGPY